MLAGEIMAKEKNIHEGHRKRLFEMAERVGVENMYNVQALETILCLIFPRGDVNPLAHRLIDKYKTISAIVKALVEDLTLVEGINKTSAMKLRALVGICRLLMVENNALKPHVDKISDICVYAEQLLRFVDSEEMHIISIGANNEVLASKKLSTGSVDTVEVDMSAVSFFVVGQKAKRVVLVHNHPNGYCSPSTQDIESFKKMTKLFAFSGCTLVDSLVLGVDGVYSIDQKRIALAFEREEIKNEKLDNIERSDDIEEILKKYI